MRFWRFAILRSCLPWYLANVAFNSLSICLLDRSSLSSSLSDTSWYISVSSSASAVLAVGLMGGGVDAGTVACWDIWAVMLSVRAREAGVAVAMIVLERSRRLRFG